MLKFILEKISLIKNSTKKAINIKFKWLIKEKIYLKSNF